MQTDIALFNPLSRARCRRRLRSLQHAGAGFLEKVYEKALLAELALQGIRATSQVPFTVTYKSHPVGTYYADILVEDTLVVELKCVDRLGNEHTAQCLNYLRGTGLPVCLLVNFQKPRVDWKRVAL